jgi:hypothetical protein
VDRGGARIRQNLVCGDTNAVGIYGDGNAVTVVNAGLSSGFSS